MSDSAFSGQVPRRFVSGSDALRELGGVLALARPLIRAYAGGLDGDLRERVMVSVSQVNACGPCTQVHHRWALRAGVTTEELEALGIGHLADLDPRSRSAVVYAVDLAERRFRGPASAEAIRAAAEHLSGTELVQIKAIARAMALANLTASTFSASKPAPNSGAASHPVFARVWARMAGKVGSDRQRTELLAGLQGRVVEVGAGEGRNFALYPPEVSEVLAIEPEPYLRRMAEQAAVQATVPVRVTDGTAEALPIADGECDAVISSLLLCSVTNQPTALAELHRVLKPGGQLRFFEHVRAQHRLGTSIQVGLDRSGLWPRLGAGCHLSRDTLQAMTNNGFAVDTVSRSSSGPGQLGIPFVLGSARKHS